MTWSDALISSWTVQQRIGNTRELIYNNIYPQQIYYDAFNDPVEDDKSELPYGE